MVNNKLCVIKSKSVRKITILVNLKLNDPTIINHLKVKFMKIKAVLVSLTFSFFLAQMKPKKRNCR